MYYHDAEVFHHTYTYNHFLEFFQILTEGKKDPDIIKTQDQQN